MSKDDQALVNKCREAANAFARALSEASEAGLLLSCESAPGITGHYGDRLTSQRDWRVNVYARREHHF